MIKARAAGLGLSVVALVALSGACGSESERKSFADYCSAAQSSAAECKDPTGCDDALAARCEGLDGILSPSTLDAARECLEGGCGVQGCLAAAQGSARASAAHRDLAEKFCSTCAADAADCRDTFYAPKSGFAGAIVLPYGDSIAEAVARDCIEDAETCRATFATCASEAIAKAMEAAVEPRLADCIVSSFLLDAEDGAGTSPSQPGETPGTGTTPPEGETCTPQNCPGCCRGNTCETGTADLGCGTGGAACEACTDGKRCTGGKCEQKCGPDNCTGCCDGDTCKTGTDKDSCGGGGVACASCTAVGPTFVCANKQCADQNCQASCPTGCCTSAGCQPGTDTTACGTGGGACAACDYGERCGTTRACELDPLGVWDLHVAFVSIPTKNKSGASWDVNKGAPDPYAVFYSSLGNVSHTAKTAEFEDTYLPFWEQITLKQIQARELMNNVSFEVWDSDLQFDDLIGGCKIPSGPAIFDRAVHSHLCPGTASTVPVEIVYRLRRPGF